MAILTARNLSKLYAHGQVLALKNISFEINAGEFVAVLGPSGCGKTTLLRLTAGLDRATGGEISFHNQPIKGSDLDRCYLFQEPRLFPWLKVGANIRLANSKADIDDLSIQLGLADFLDAYPSQLSGGMAKRAALARALVANPKLLLLDEPLTNLDLITRQGLQELLWQIWQERGITLMMVTHDLDEALALATRIIIMTPRPGEIYQDISLNLEFPRQQDTEDYLRWRSQILQWTMEAFKHEKV